MRDVTNPLPQPSATYKRLNGYGRRNDETSSTSSRISDNSIIYKGHSFNLTKQPLCDLLKEGVRRTPGASTSSTVANDQVNGNGTDFSFVHPKDCAIIVERPARRASSMKAGPSPKVNGFRENKNRTSNLSHLDFSGAPRRLTRHSQPSISLPDISNGQQLPEEEIDIMRVCLKFCQKLGKTASETFQMLKLAFREAAISQSKTFKWFACFKSDRESTQDDARLRRPPLENHEELTKNWCFNKGKY
ncbi:hypothetical protein LAZ67_7003617 [Cordylochernes scorpioides]|uniref:Mos1 transposase HTH domain-containing protein n=1 Tax=Cordylochernes scorpioides TaxID=51811 RepID=A0ABY6KNY4_9ARAC|nr:hypothetical protein LAZ67_7003617 [Cordylochernes scorpioides]